MDLKKALFGDLTPHWIIENPIENKDTLKAMVMLFGPILQKHKGQTFDPTAILLPCAACIVYYSDLLLSVIISHPGHDFTKIVILHGKNLLEQLLLLVTTTATKGVIDTPTGIPPHVEHAIQMKEILTQVISLCEIQKEPTATLVSTVEEAIDKKVYDSDNINSSRLCEILADHQAKSSGIVNGRLLVMNERLKSIQESFHSIASGSEQGVFCAAQDNNRTPINSTKITCTSTLDNFSCT